MSNMHTQQCSCSGDCHAQALPQNYGIKQFAEEKRLLLLAIVLFAAGFFFNGLLTVQFVLYFIAWLLAGKEVLLTSLKKLGKGNFLDENFLMSAATVGAFILKQYPEAAAVMIFYQVGETFQEYAAGNSRRSIKSLLAMRPPFARVQEGASWRKTAPESVQPGQVIAVYPGKKSRWTVLW